MELVSKSLLNTVCSETKVNEISALLFCKVFISTKCLFILYGLLLMSVGFVLTIMVLTIASVARQVN